LRELRSRKQPIRINLCLALFSGNAGHIVSGFKCDVWHPAVLGLSARHRGVATEDCTVADPEQIDQNHIVDWRTGRTKIEMPAHVHAFRVPHYFENETDPNRALVRDAPKEIMVAVWRDDRD
jgi:hypothetical protein